MYIVWADKATSRESSKDGLPQMKYAEKWQQLEVDCSASQQILGWTDIPNG